MTRRKRIFILVVLSLVTGFAQPLARAQAPAVGSADLEPNLILSGHALLVSCVAFSPDGRWLAATVSTSPRTGRGDDKIMLWKTDDIKALLRK